MPNAGEILNNFYAAVAKKDIAAARKYVADDILFLGLFETYHNAPESTLPR
jgi:ketosteroid isomerase-like protein